MLGAPYKYLEILYEASKKQDLIQSIFELVLTKNNVCFEDISEVKLPEKLCPFGCKKDDCPYDYDVNKCPHNLDEKDLEELGMYLIKFLYYEDGDKKEQDEVKKVPKKVLDAFMAYDRPGNYMRADKWQSRLTK